MRFRADRSWRRLEWTTVSSILIRLYTDGIQYLIIIIIIIIIITLIIIITIICIIIIVITVS